MSAKHYSKAEIILEIMEEFGGWTSSKDRQKTSWYLSLRVWAQQKYDEAYKAEDPLLRKK